MILTVQIMLIRKYLLSTAERNKTNAEKKSVNNLNNCISETLVEI